MMTSLSNPSSTEQQVTDGRTVRDIVEHNHEVVSEPWCRRIFRQLLQSLEVQYGMRMPHRRISPDTILLLESGDPMLLPDGDEVADDARIANDLRDLATVIHYAITLELLPEGPLRGRNLPGYSDSFLLAIDRCMASEPGHRPQSIEALRNLLGIVVLPPPAPLALDEAATPAPSATITEVRRAHAPDGPAVRTEGPQRGRRWLWLGVAALLLVGALAALLTLLRQTDARDALALPAPAPAPELSAPPSYDPPTAADPASASTAAPDAPRPLVTLPQDKPPLSAGPAIDETGLDAGATVATPQAPPTAVQLAPQGAPAPVAGTTYKLVVRPWGRIVVDGIERGISPPLKHLTLPPGEHTIGIVNPSFPEHTVTVRSARGQKGVIEMDFTEEDTP